MQTKRFFNTSTILGLLTAGLFLSLAYFLDRDEVYKDDQRILFSNAMANRRASCNSATTLSKDEAAVVEANAQQALENSLIVYRRVVEEQKHNWWYTLNILPGADEFCAARAEEQIANSQGTVGNTDDSIKTDKEYCVMFPGDVRSDLCEIWTTVVHNMEVLLQNQQQQEQQGGKGKQGKGKDKGKNKGNQGQDDDHQPLQPDQDSQSRATKGAERKI